ncbi:MAG: hypothetical protein P1U77_13455 [Rubripirellula sp.]|nr:hypothetical protein [Planctomycetaceae bacterium]MDF1842438.1 hypothetical protein [Rubripirellula sp.]
MTRHLARFAPVGSGDSLGRHNPRETSGSFRTNASAYLPFTRVLSQRHDLDLPGLQSIAVRFDRNGS